MFVYLLAFTFVIEILNPRAKDMFYICLDLLFLLQVGFGYIILPSHTQKFTFCIYHEWGAIPGSEEA